MSKWKDIMQIKLLFFGAFILSQISFSLDFKAQNVKEIQLRDFNLQSSSVISQPGEMLSGASYKTTDYWFPVKVPSTVLTGLVANNVYPDPYIGMNNMLIPDASDSFNHHYHLEQYSYLPNEPNPTGDIGKNVTMLCSVGWDWMPAVRVNGSDTNVAHLALHLSLNNFSNISRNGHLKIIVSTENFKGESFTVNENISVDANNSKDIKLTSENIKQFIIQKPHLWWPNGYGSSNLYRIRLQYEKGKI